MTEILDHLYVIGEGGDCGIVKVGRSVNPAERLSGIQTGNPRKVSLLLVVPEAGQHENAVHQKLINRRLGGEWFDLSKGGDPVEQVQRVLDEILRAEPERPLVAAAPRPVSVPARPDVVAITRRDSCAEAGCSVTSGERLGLSSAMLTIVTDWFLANHPDPAAYLLEQGFAWHCIEEMFAAHLPEVSRRTLEEAASADRAA